MHGNPGDFLLQEFLADSDEGWQRGWGRPGAGGQDTGTLRRRLLS